MWSVSEGNIACKEKYPTLAAFKIPSDNIQTTKQLISELSRLQAELNVTEPDCIQSINKSYISMPQGSSLTSRRRFGNRVIKAVKSLPQDGQPKQYGTILSMIDKADPDTFLNVITKRGYSTQLTPKITPEFFTAMSKEANLKTKQERIINGYLTVWFGKRICATELEIASVGNDYVPYVTKTLHFDSMKVDYAYRSPVCLIQKYSTLIFSSLPSIKKIELCVGGDHGKGAFTMMLIVIVRYEDKDPLILEFQIGQIDATSDSIEYLSPLLKHLNPFFTAMKFIDGKTRVTIADDGKVIYVGDEGEDGIDVEIFLIGKRLLFCSY